MGGKSLLERIKDYLTCSIHEYKDKNIEGLISEKEGIEENETNTEGMISEKENKTFELKVEDSGESLKVYLPTDGKMDELLIHITYGGIYASKDGDYSPMLFKIGVKGLKTGSNQGEFYEKKGRKWVIHSSRDIRCIGGFEEYEEGSLGYRAFEMIEKALEIKLRPPKTHDLEERTYSVNPSRVISIVREIKEQYKRYCDNPLSELEDCVEYIGDRLEIKGEKIDSMPKIGVLDLSVQNIGELVMAEDFLTLKTFAGQQLLSDYSFLYAIGEKYSVAE